MTNGLSLTVAALLAVTALHPIQAQALSEFGVGGTPNRGGSEAETQESQGGLPLPEPLINRRPVDGSDDAGILSSEPDPQDAEIILDVSQLPEPVRRMRELIVEAAASGDYEHLRPLTNPGPRQTQVDLGNDEPVDAMRGLSGDSEGLEILAILIDILSAGAARMDAGTPDEVYVWPYFAGRTLASLTPPERVELLRIVTAGDLLGMEEAGNYNFYRLSITPDGEWKSLMSGD
ncbi:MAG: hypothetical protein ACK4N1_07630 [Pseudorhizobium sp.]